MPREIVTIQVGQCGNQIGRCFWDLALKEHAAAARGGRFDDAMSSYFRNVDARTGQDLEGRNNPIRCLKARAVLVDTEEGVLGQTLASPLGELFDEAEFVRGVSGAGNNFAHGFFGYGEEYAGKIVDSVRRATERCDSLQAFFLTHSTGGGTGSGLGTRVLELLRDNFSSALRFTASVLPSADDDVITSPYNALFALEQLRENADCVFPMDNQALLDICAAISGSNKPARGRAAGPASGPGSGPAVASLASRGEAGGASSRVRAGRRPSSLAEPPSSARGEADGPAFDDMNSVAAHMLSNLTSCARFSGKMNVDLSELTTNLVPFPKMQFVLSSLSPLAVLARGPANDVAMARQVDRDFAGALSRSNQLLKSDPANGQFYACALLVRGGINLADLNRNVERFARQVDMVPWNEHGGFKVGHCNVPPVGQPHSLLCLSNNTCAADVFAEAERRFLGLYGTRRKAYVHHYTRYLDEDAFPQALEAMRSLQHDYLARAKPPPPLPRPTPVV